MKRLFFILVFVFFFNTGAYADEYYSNETQVVLNKDGSADFIINMDYRADSGSEYYTPISNLGESKIINYSVSELVEGVEQKYEALQTWDIKKDIKYKENKCGIVKNNDSYELCFGIGNYERKQYIIRYTVTDFAKILKDKDMVFWKFINDDLEAAPKYLNIILTKENGEIFDQNNVRMWGFGLKGDIGLDKGSIRLVSLEEMNRENYAVILLALEKGYFNKGQVINKTFDDYKEAAFKNSDYEDKGSVVGMLFAVLGTAAMLFIISIISVMCANGDKIYGGYKKGQLKGYYYRKAPSDEWWYIGQVLKNAGFDTDKSIISAFLLKWILEGNISVLSSQEKKLLSFKDITSLVLNFKDDYVFESEIESELKDIIVTASGEDGILQEKELKKFISDKDNYDCLSSFFDNVKDKSIRYLLSKGYIDLKGKIFTKKVFTESGKELSKNTIQYYNYLYDYTLLFEREAKEVINWREMFIYACLFGITKILKKQFKDLVPEEIKREMVREGVDFDSIFYYYLYVNDISNGLINNYNKVKLSNAKKGFGGYTSSFGGGGSFGGGSGGGSR